MSGRPKNVGTTNGNAEFAQPVGKVFDLDTEQMIEVDRAMMQDYKIELIQMMENAGRNLAHLARARFLDGDPRGKHVVVLAGTGGNGGGALVCARRLHNWGAKAEVYLSAEPDKYQGVPAHQLDVLKRMQLPVFYRGSEAHYSRSMPVDLIIDGLIGYSLSGAPRGPASDLILWANNQSGPVLSLDTPSGVDAATGQVFEPSITADATMTLALPKKGLRSIDAVVGELYLADISVPPELYNKFLSIEIGPIFAESDIVRLV